jgi:hypothetical protein
MAKNALKTASAGGTTAIFGCRVQELALSNTVLVPYEYVETVNTAKRCGCSDYVRQVRNLFESEFSAECDLVLPVSVCSIPSFP